jgi:hypothetical protein
VSPLTANACNALLGGRKHDRAPEDRLSQYCAFRRQWR